MLISSSRSTLRGDCNEEPADGERDQAAGTEGKRGTRRGQRGQGGRRATMVAKDQPLLEVQADKAALDVPSPVAGRITEVLVKAANRSRSARSYCLHRRRQRRGAHGAGASGRTGRAAPEKKPAAKKPETPAPAAAAHRTPRRRSRSAGRRHPPPAHADNRIAPAGPATRRLARELGVDLTQVPGSGRPAASSRKTSRRSSANSPPAPWPPPTAGGAVAAPPLPNFEDWGPVERATAVGDPQGDGPADEPGLEPDPPRHAARPGRHHRPGSVPQAAAGRQGTEADRDRVRPQGGGHRPEASSRPSTPASTSPATSSSSSAIITSAWPWTPRTACWCR